VVPYLSKEQWSAYFAIGITVFLQTRGVIGWSACLVLVLIGSAIAVAVNGAHYLIPIILSLMCLYSRYPVPRVMVWLGTISYSLYLVHYFVGLRTFRLLARFGEGDWYYGLCYLAAILASILAAWLVFKLVEQPTMKLASSIRYRPQQLRRDPALQGDSCLG
jgi:peptidoglycan/LPS O-acetylase OafA/YrhL